MVSCSVVDEKQVLNQCWLIVTTLSDITWKVSVRNTTAKIADEIGLNKWHFPQAQWFNWPWFLEELFNPDKECHSPVAWQPIMEEHFYWWVYLGATYIYLSLLAKGVWSSHLLLYPRPTKLEGGYTGFTLSVRLSVRPSVCRRHGFRSITQVCFGISISNFICMLMVAISRSLLIFSDVTFKMAAWRPYWIFLVSGL